MRKVLSSLGAVALGGALFGLVAATPKVLVDDYCCDYDMECMGGPRLCAMISVKDADKDPPIIDIYCWKGAPLACDPT